MTLAPRPYQSQAIDRIRAALAVQQRTLCVIPTGGGKTIVAAHVADGFLPHGRVMVLCHRDELVRQAVDKFRRVTGEDPAVEKADEKTIERGIGGPPPIVVASIQTLNSGDDKWRRMQKFKPEDFAFVWVDEAHRAVSKTFRRVIDYFAQGNTNLKVLGVTATPDRADGEGLGQVFQSCAFSYELPEIIRDGYLVPIRQRSVRIEGLDFAKVRITAGDLNAGDLEAAMMVEKPLHGVAHATVEIACGLSTGVLATIKDRDNRDEAMAQVLAGNRAKRTLIFTVTVAHAERLAEIINRWLPESAAHVDGTMPPDKRRDIYRRFKIGQIQFLANCMVLGEGYDEPAIELIVMARPTKSRALYCQQLGRGTRPLESLADLLGTLPDASARRDAIEQSEKPCLINVDFVGNCGKHKLVTSADILGDETYSEEVIERAKEKSLAGAVDVDDALEAAEAEVAAEQDDVLRAAEEAQVKADAEDAKRAAAAAKRAGLVGTTRYTIRDVDPFDPYMLTPRSSPVPVERHGPPATAAQIWKLESLGVSRQVAESYGKRQASAVISKLLKKREAETAGAA